MLAITFYICIITTRTRRNWRYLLNFFGVLTGQDFAGGMVNEQEETHKSTIFDYTFTV